MDRQNDLQPPQKTVCAWLSMDPWPSGQNPENKETSDNPSRPMDEDDEEGAEEEEESREVKGRAQKGETRRDPPGPEP